MVKYGYSYFYDNYIECVERLDKVKLLKKKNTVKIHFGESNYRRLKT